MKSMKRAGFWSSVINFGIEILAALCLIAGVVLAIVLRDHFTVLAMVAFVPALAALFYFASGKYQDLYFWLNNRFIESRKTVSKLPYTATGKSASDFKKSNV